MPLNPATDIAIVFGASDKYPILQSTLMSCKRDMTRLYHWYADNFSISGAPFRAFFDEKYTRALFFAELWRVATVVKPKIGIIGGSGHGTRFAINGQIHSANVFYDSDFANPGETFGLDSHYAKVFEASPDTRWYWTEDICESGDLAYRLITNGVNKFIDPPLGMQLEMEHIQKTNPVIRTLAPTFPNVAYISGTGGAGFYSIDEGDGGAFTKHLTQLKPDTARNMAALLDKQMDSQQQPQAHGGLADAIWLS